MSETRTLFFVNPWRGRIGPNVGMEQLGLEALRRDHKVELVTQRRDDFVGELEARGAVCHVMPALELTPRTANPARLLGHCRRGWALANRVGGLARAAGADALCINSENMLLMPRAGQIAGCPVALIMRGLRVGELGLAGNVYFKTQQRWVRRYIALVRLGADMLARKGVPREKISVIPNGVDTELYAPRARDEALAAELGVGQDQLVVGAVTHLTPRKGVHHLVEAMAGIAARVAGVKCLIVGGVPTPEDEPFAQAVSRRIQELHLGDKVRLLGYRTDVPALLNLFDVMVHPSESENCPRSTLEAQASGVPVVGFRVGGMPEMVADGVTGVLVEPFDTGAMAEAVIRLLADPAQRQRLGQAGRRRAVRDFDLKTNVGRIIDLLASLRQE